MATSTLDIQELDRKNLLNMPSEALRAGGRYLLIYKAPQDNIPLGAVRDVLEQRLMGSMYPTANGNQVGHTFVIPVAMAAKPQSTIVEAIATKIKTVFWPGQQILVQPLQLTHIIPSDPATASSLERTAVVASQTPAQQSDPLGIKALGKGISDTTKKVLSTMKWLSIAVIAIVLLIVIGQARGAGKALVGK